jgi:hypothetical protein
VVDHRRGGHGKRRDNTDRALFDHSRLAKNPAAVDVERQRHDGIVPDEGEVSVGHRPGCRPFDNPDGFGAIGMPASPITRWPHVVSYFDAGRGTG